MCLTHVGLHKIKDLPVRLPGRRTRPRLPGGPPLKTHTHVESAVVHSYTATLVVFPTASRLSVMSRTLS